MIPVDEAIRRILENLPPPAAECIDSRSAYGRVLAQSLTATSNIPPFSKSAVDGYAVRTEDLVTIPAELRCAGESRAGSARGMRVRPGEAVAIMTGAPVPDGADAVQMIEKARRSADGSRVTILSEVRAGENVIPEGSEASTGKVVLESGRYVGPPEMAILAMLGIRHVSVFRKPGVALASTGDELVEADQTPGPGQIRNSNAPSVAAQLRQLGLDAEYLGIARDDKAEIRRVILEGLRRDVLILTGGVSVGAYDFVEEILVETGLEVIFSGVAVRPGKPTVFARRGDKIVFGLPGNPISTFVSFELFVRPALERICGFAAAGLFRVQGRLSLGVKHKSERASFIPARLSWNREGWGIEPLPWKGSSDIIGFSRANGLLILPQDRKAIAEGEQVEALLLPDFWQRLTR
jgi:molybdopterin molybdotransferase